MHDNLPENVDSLKAIYRLYADFVESNPELTEEFLNVMREIVTRINTGGGNEEFKGSSELLDAQYIREIGLVTAQSAAAEDAAGTLIMHAELGPLGGSPTNNSWAASGKQLITALQKHIPEDLLKRFDRALALRNHVVHGFHGIISEDAIRMMNNSTVAEPGSRITVKRNLKKDEDPYQMKPWPDGSLPWLHREFVDIEGAFEKIKWEIIGQTL